MTTRDRAKTQRRDGIIAAARALMRRSGVVGFSMRTLAENAGVSIATPYNLFGSKQSILLAVLDANLADYERALADLRADEVEVLFEAISLMNALLATEPDFYRGVLVAVFRDGGPEIRHMVTGPRYLLWKKLLREATLAGLLAGDVDPDAFAIALSQLILSNILDWAHGSLEIDEMEARSRYGLALALRAVATDRSRVQVDRQLRSAEAKLQRIWRNGLARRLERGRLDDESAALFADQLKYVQSESDLEISA